MSIAESHKLIDKMDSLEKLRIYMQYFIVQLGLIHNFHVFFNYENDKPVQIEKKYLWKGLHIMKFENFINPKSKQHGIYDWHWKFN